MPPSWAVLPLVLLATMATVIASQALISGAFSLTSQAVQLGYLPRVTIDHTSDREIGQVYVRSVNYALLAASLGLVIAFRTSSNLAAAYGVAVTTTMVVTTALLYVVMRDLWHWRRSTAVTLTALFLVVDLGFFAANVLKIPAGGWVPLVLGLLVFTVMTTWRRGQSLIAGVRSAELPIERFIGSITDHPQPRVPGTAVFMHSAIGLTPPALLVNLRHNGVLHETILIVNVQTARVPHVPPARRSTVHHLGEGFHEVLLRFGFTDEPDVPRALASIVLSDFGVDMARIVYFLGQETVIPTELPGMAMWRERLFAVFHRNRADVVEHFCLPPDQVIEIGSKIEV
jgi:KUP system potassium uptake protein